MPLLFQGVQLEERTPRDLTTLDIDVGVCSFTQLRGRFPQESMWEAQHPVLVGWSGHKGGGIHPSVLNQAKRFSFL